MDDILADTWVWQEITKRGLKKGLEQGEVKGRMQALLQFVELRFPSLQTLAQQVTERGYSLEQLQEILKRLYCASTVEDARKALNYGQ